MLLSSVPSPFTGSPNTNAAYSSWQMSPMQYASASGYAPTYSTIDASKPPFAPATPTMASPGARTTEKPPPWEQAPVPQPNGAMFELGGLPWGPGGHMPSSAGKTRASYPPPAAAFGSSQHGAFMDLSKMHGNMMAHMGMGSLGMLPPMGPPSQFGSWGGPVAGMGLISANNTNSKTIWDSAGGLYRTDIMCPGTRYEDVTLELVGGKTLELTVEFHQDKQPQEKASWPFMGMAMPPSTPFARSLVLLPVDADTSQLKGDFNNGEVTVCYPRLMEAPKEAQNPEITMGEAEVQELLRELQNAKLELDKAAKKHREAQHKLLTLRSETSRQKALERTSIPLEMETEAYGVAMNGGLPSKSEASM